MPLAKPTAGGKYATVIKTEEKGSDVNLASHLLVDAFTHSFDCAIVVSGDSDLATPIEMVRNLLNKPVGVLLPQLLSTLSFKNTRRSARLKQVATFFRAGIREGVLKASQFPDTMVDKHGQFRKPAAW
jgi:NYN domain